MKSATEILILIGSALGGFFIWALMKRTKEIVYLIVRNAYLPIVVMLFVVAIYELLGWAEIKGFLLSVLRVVGIVIVGFILVALLIILVVNVVRYTKDRNKTQETPGSNLPPEEVAS